MSTARFTQLELIQLSMVITKWVLFLVGHFVKLILCIIDVKYWSCENVTF